ncbi:hypothetical protein B0H66DRAFT_533254 [Apodospora peruviana]|uniref:Uncharacterized protein n=1 Tax=Apodospora peruviana TaxID=516989 RepID=A0AAE0I5X5_9PEZI|nr:hypothetical protein B0H66DRAFT_533254 [Apodospora peruviana]
MEPQPITAQNIGARFTAILKQPTAASYDLFTRVFKSPKPVPSTNRLAELRQILIVAEEEGVTMKYLRTAVKRAHLWAHMDQPQTTELVRRKEFIQKAREKAQKLRETMLQPGQLRSVKEEMERVKLQLQLPRTSDSSRGGVYFGQVNVESGQSSTAGDGMQPQRPLARREMSRSSVTSGPPGTSQGHEEMRKFCERELKMFEEEMPQFVRSPTSQPSGMSQPRRDNPDEEMLQPKCEDSDEKAGLSTKVKQDRPAGRHNDGA